eukprot:m51a1_g4905 hypothetical protein (144) ;mRNA; f:164215-164948
MADDDIDTGDVQVQDTPDQKSESEWSSEIADREQQVTAALNSGKVMTALPAIVENPPVQCKNQALKDRNSEAVLKLLVAIREQQIGQVVQGMTPEQLDGLMKYIYRHLGNPEVCGHMLKWHEAAFQKGGLGSIVRVLGERRSL